MSGAPALLPGGHGAHEVPLGRGVDRFRGITIAESDGFTRAPSAVAVDTGQPVRVHCDAHVETPRPFGTVRCVEQGTFTLASTTPRR